MGIRLILKIHLAFIFFVSQNASANSCAEIFGERFLREGRFVNLRAENLVHDITGYFAGEFHYSFRNKSGKKRELTLPVYFAGSKGTALEKRFLSEYVFDYTKLAKIIYSGRIELFDGEYVVFIDRERARPAYATEPVSPRNEPAQVIQLFN